MPTSIVITFSVRILGALVGVLIPLIFVRLDLPIVELSNIYLTILISILLKFGYDRANFSDLNKGYPVTNIFFALILTFFISELTGILWTSLLLAFVFSVISYINRRRGKFIIAAITDVPIILLLNTLLLYVEIENRVYYEVSNFMLVLLLFITRCISWNGLNYSFNLRAMLNQSMGAIYSYLFTLSLGLSYGNYGLELRFLERVFFSIGIFNSLSNVFTQKYILDSRKNLINRFEKYSRKSSIIIAISLLLITIFYFDTNIAETFIFATIYLIYNQLPAIGIAVDQVGLTNFALRINMLLIITMSLLAFVELPLALFAIFWMGQYWIKKKVKEEI